MIATYTRAAVRPTRRRAPRGQHPRASTALRARRGPHRAQAERPHVLELHRPPAYGPERPHADAQDGISKLWLDGKVHADLHESVPQIGAPEAWAAGYDGTGVTVALLDTGVDVNHPDLSTQIADTQSFVPDEDIADVVGHGTHVALHDRSAPAPPRTATTRASPPAPSSRSARCWTTPAPGRTPGSWPAWSGPPSRAPKVVNMSLGDTEFVADGSDPMSQAVDSLSAQYGTLFVIAAGNDGPETHLVTRRGRRRAHRRRRRQAGHPGVVLQHAAR